MVTLLRTAADHARGAIDHAEASERVRTAASDLPEGRFAPRPLMAAETFVRATGLFVASLPFRPLIHAALARRASDTGRADDVVRASVSAVHAGDRDRAEGTIARLAPAAVERDAAADTVARYLDVWAGRPVGPLPAPTRAAHEVADRRFAGRIGEGPVLVYGPGPTTSLPPLHGLPSDELRVIRILMPEVYAWDSPQDLVAGRSDVAYLNHEAQLWLSDLPEERRRDIAGRFSVLVAKKSADMLVGVDHPGLRVAWSAAPLFLTGSENTVPAILFDLLALADVPVGVVGTTFFASDTSYRPDNRRFQFYEGVKVDGQGRTGLVLERCTMLASHNALENRTLVANLVAAGRVTGDAEFTEAVSLTDEAYLERLDRLYGAPLL